MEMLILNLWTVSVLCGHSFFTPATTANDLRLQKIWINNVNVQVWYFPLAFVWFHINKATANL